MATTDPGELRSSLDANYVWLTAAERRIFDRLLKSRERWVAIKSIAAMLYQGWCTPNEVHSVRVHVSRLRAKLRTHDAPFSIETVGGGSGITGSYRLRYTGAE